MKIVLKYTFLIISLSISIISCKRPDPGSDNPAGTTVQLNPDFLGIYESNNQGNLTMEIEIIVDNLDSNMNPISNFSTYFVTRSNISTINNYTFRNVQVPDGGTYAVTAVVRGAVCFTQCGSGSQICTEFDSGRPFFREVVTKRNQNSAPLSIHMFPTFVTCQ